MRRKLVLIVLVGLLVLGTVQGALAFGRGGMGFGNGLMAAKGPFSGLDLTSEQQQKLQELQIQFLEKTQNLRLTLQKLALELRNLWSQEPLDEKAITEKTSEMVKTRLQLVEKAREMRSEVESILTPEQLEKLSDGSYRPMGPRGGWGGHGRWGRRGIGGAMPFGRFGF